MPHLLLLVGDLAKAHNDNHARLERAFADAGWTVTRADHESVEVRANRLWIANGTPEAFDLIWLVGFGRAAGFFDRVQLLDQLPAHRFVNAPGAMTSLHGKHRWLERMPETHTSSSAAYLLEVLSSGGEWVLKPPAGSYGRDVERFAAGEATLDAVRALKRRNGDGYLIAQRYLPEIKHGEKRTLVAAGELIGTYLRRPTSTLANLSAGGVAERATLDPEERAWVEPLARELCDLGIRFGAIDSVGEALIEVNVANPGGLATLEALTGVNLTPSVARAIGRWHAGQNGTA
ncbi:MAG: hypothetical protein AAGE43_02615 [Pseudomonadota bacterium]